MRINADLDNFVYSASHDLMAPMANIEGMFNLIKKKIDKDDDEVKQFINMIDKSVVKFKAVINDLSDIGKIEGETLKQENINLEELLSEIRLSVLDQVTATNTKIHCDFPVGEINFSKKNLRGVLYNLVINSIKYKSPEREPEIMIRTEKAPGFVLLTFSDNGMGMRADKVDKIFTLYKRLAIN